MTVKKEHICAWEYPYALSQDMCHVRAIQIKKQIIENPVAASASRWQAHLWAHYMLYEYSVKLCQSVCVCLCVCLCVCE